MLYTNLTGVQQSILSLIQYDRLWFLRHCISHREQLRVMLGSVCECPMSPGRLIRLPKPGIPLIRPCGWCLDKEDDYRAQNVWEGFLGEANEARALGQAHVCTMIRLGDGGWGEERSSLEANRFESIKASWPSLRIHFTLPMIVSPARGTSSCAALALTALSIALSKSSRDLRTASTQLICKSQ